MGSLEPVAYNSNSDYDDSRWRQPPPEARTCGANNFHAMYVGCPSYLSKARKMAHRQSGPGDSPRPAGLKIRFGKIRFRQRRSPNLSGLVLGKE